MAQFLFEISASKFEQKLIQIASQISELVLNVLANVWLIFERAVPLRALIEVPLPNVVSQIPYLEILGLPVTLRQQVSSLGLSLRLDVVFWRH